MSSGLLHFGLCGSVLCLLIGCSGNEPSASEGTNKEGTLNPGSTSGAVSSNDASNPTVSPGAGSGNTGSVAPVVSPSATGTPTVTNDGSGTSGEPTLGVTSIPTGGNSSGAGTDTVPANTGGNTESQVTSGPVDSGSSTEEPPFNSEVDENGKTNAKPGDRTSVNQDYLKFGEVRILNNNWGSAELNCQDSQFSVFVNQDRSFGWDFGRGACGGMNSKPDFPQIEFGIHPFGIGNVLVTSPEFSSTSLLPLQIKDIQSASVNINGLNIALQEQNSWNITFEFWLSEKNPLTEGDAGVYAELMTFWGWQNGRWPDSLMPGMGGPVGDGAGTDINSGGRGYKLWVQRDDWADGKWRYFQFRDNSGPNTNFNGTLDVKPFLDYLVQQRNYSQELWVTRLEVGSEIDDGTRGTVTLQGITFEVNGESRAAIVAE